MTGKTILTTNRLVIKEFTIKDAPFILELVNTEDWIQHIGDRKVRTLEDAAFFIKNNLISSYAKHNFGLWGMELISTNVCIGMCGLVNRESLDDIDIGFALLPSYYRNGYAFEAAQATLGYAYNELQFSKVVGITSKDNFSSIQLLIKLGMQHEKSITLSENDVVELYSPSKN